MAPSRVDPNQKQAKSAIDQVEKIRSVLIEWQELFQLQIKLQFIWLGGHLKNYIINVLMREKHSNFQLQIFYIR